MEGKKKAPEMNGSDTSDLDFKSMISQIPEEIKPEQAPAKAKVVPMNRSGNGQQTSGKLTIVINHGQLRDLTNAAARALNAANSAQTRLFANGSLVQRIAKNKDGLTILQTLSDAGVKGEMAESAQWVTMTEKGKIKDAFPPGEVVKDYLNLPEIPLPMLDRLVNTPVYVRDQNGQARLITKDGYHESARVYMEKSADLQNMARVSTTPSDAEVAEAKRWLKDELLCDFPFADESGKAHTIAYLLLPFVRSLIAGPTPIHLIDAPDPGTGKGLLNDAVGLTAIGRPAAVMPEGGSNDEYRKQITSVLLEGSPMISIDNVNKGVASGALAAAITATEWRDRILGTNTTTRVPNLSAWAMTGNNVQMSHENVRRTIWIRLDAKRSDPFTRSVFKHPKLLQWIRGNRGRLVWSLLTLVQNWVAQGEPKGTEIMGSFEEWVAVIGGILQSGGIDGLLGNQAEFRGASDTDGEEIKNFVSAWADSFGVGQPCALGELFQLCVEGDLMGSVLGSKNERSQRTNLGLALKRRHMSWIDDIMIQRLENNAHTGAAQYQLVRKEEEEETKSPPKEEQKEEQPWQVF